MIRFKGPLIANLGAAFLIASMLVPVGTTAVSAHVPGLIDQPGGLTYHDCDEIFAFPMVPFEQARTVVPERFEVARDPVTGDASLLIAAHSCEQATVAGKTVDDTVDSYMSVAIVSPEPGEPGAPPHASFLVPGERDGDATDAGLSRVEGYLVQWVTNDQPHADWLKQAGLGNKARLVAGLAFANDPVPGPDTPGAADPDFELSVPAPAPSPFHVEAMRTEPGPELWEAAVNLWADVGGRTLIIHVEHQRRADQRFGPAVGTITSDDPRSVLSGLFADRQTRPINDPVTVAFSSGAFTDGQLTTCIRTATTPCTPDDH